MTNRQIATLAAAGLLALGTAAGVAHAAVSDQDSRDGAAIAAMKVTLPQAIATAEQQEGGRAVGVDIAHGTGTPQIAVEVAGPKGVRTVLVDAMTGRVTATHDAGQDDETND